MATSFYPTGDCDCEGPCPKCDLAHAKGDLHHLAQEINKLTAGHCSLDQCVDEIWNQTHQFPGDLGVRIQFFMGLGDRLVKEIGDYLGVDVFEEWRADRREEENAVACAADNQ